MKKDNYGMNIDAYKTSMGSAINMLPIIKKIADYLVKTNGDLNYEYADTKDTGLVFITGINDDEKELPVWDHPIIMEDVRGKTIIVSDIRKYVKPEEGMDTLEKHIKDQTGFTFCIIRALITLDFITGNLGELRNIERNVTSGFVGWVSDSIASKTYLNPGEKTLMDIAIAHYLLILMNGNDVDRLDIDTIISKIANTKLSYPINRKLVEESVNKLKHKIDGINTLADNIEILINNGTTRVDSNVIVQVLSNSWFGHGGDRMAIIAIENVPTWISMLYINIIEKSFKRSRIAMIVQKNKRAIDTDKIDKDLTNYIKERTNTTY